MSVMNEVLPDDPRVRRAASTVLGVWEAIDREVPIEESFERVDVAESRGYFLPDEDERVRLRYAQYLAERAALLSALQGMEAVCGSSGEAWGGRRPAFLVALAASTLLVRRTRELLAIAGRSRLLRKKLDEADAIHGLPRKTFTQLYRATTSIRRLTRLRDALDFYLETRLEFADLAGVPPFDELIPRLEAEVERARNDGVGVRRRLRYRWFSFRRRHHSAWKHSVFRLFRWSGSLIADLKQPGVKPSGAPKRVTAALREELVALARPGDVFFTRHDDAMSNLFLPGFWPHGALFFGDEAERGRLGLALAPGLARLAADPVRFLEAKKDGVRFRPAEETLEVDCAVILRPPVADEIKAEALKRASGHAGKRYDFVFDFRSSDRLACTEVIYRGYHGLGGLGFELLPTGGRLCLPAEALIHQALEQGFQVVATCGIGKGGLLKGRAAEMALHSTRCGI